MPWIDMSWCETMPLDRSGVDLVPGQRMKAGTRQPPSQLVSFWLRNGVLAASGQVSFAIRDGRRAAREMRDRLDNLGLISFCKTTGGKGLHVCSAIGDRQEQQALVAGGRGVRSRPLSADGAG